MSEALVREIGSFDRLGQAPPPGSPPLSTCLELKHIGQTDHAMAAIGQVLCGHLTRVNETDDERSRKAQQLTNLSRSQPNLGGKHSHGMPLGQLTSRRQQDLDKCCGKSDLLPIWQA